MKNINNRLRIAIQKSGRLSDESFNLLNRCGIHVKARKDQLFCHTDNFPLDVLLVRDDDIPNLVISGVCDYGIVGTNLLNEKFLGPDASFSKDKIEITRSLDFGLCRLALAVPKEFNYTNLQSLSGCRIATSYPYLLADFIVKQNISLEVTTLTGSVEIAPRLGIADGICDLVSSGATLEANNLREVETVFESQAVLFKTTQELPAEKQRIAELLQNRVMGAQYATGSKYIMLHAPKSALDKIVELLPGAEKPTILELQGDSEKVAFHVLCRENVFWETLEELKFIGASSILVMPVEKMMI